MMLPIPMFPPKQPANPPRVLRMALAAVAAALLSGLLLFACQTADPKADGATITFKSRYDQLAAYDLVRITLKSSNGSTLDLAFQGKVEKPGDLENLPVPHWDGGAVIVSIIGYKDGAVAYWVDTHFDGRTNAKGDSQVFVVPGMALKAEVAELPLLLGDSVPLPVVTVQPAILADKSLSWTSSSPAVVQAGTATGVGGGYLKALGAGKAKLTARLNVLPSMSLEVVVDVAVPGVVPESLTLSPDTLHLTVGGAAARPTVQIRPETAGKAVAWSLTDSLVAMVDAGGSVQGLQEGTAVLRATSTSKPSLFDDIVVLVTQHFDVASVRFLKESTEIFLGGAAEDLVVEVLPSRADKTVDFTTADTSLILLKDGRISARALGEGTVIASSRENPLKRDTLKVKVSPSQVITAVSISSHAFTLYTGGEGKALTGQVAPSTALQTLRWRSGNAAVAKVDDTGKVTGVAPGKAWVYGTSAADSLKRDSAEVTVKTDAPVLTVGKDTTVFVGRTVSFLPRVAPQEYGTVVAYKWDVDGVAGWDDTATQVVAASRVYSQPGVDSARFYVRDTEGNVGTAAIQVTVQVDTAAQNGLNVRLQALTLNGVAQDVSGNARSFVLNGLTFADSLLVIEATTVEPEAELTIGGQSAKHTLRKTIRLKVQLNTIPILVTSRDKTSSLTYNVLSNRGMSYLLTGLSPTQGTLKPAFSSAVTAYTLLVPGDGPDSLKWKVSLEDTTALIRAAIDGNGNFAPSFMRSGGFTDPMYPLPGRSLLSFGAYSFLEGDSLKRPYRVDMCKPGGKLEHSKPLNYDAVSSPGMSMVSDGQDIYVAMVDAYVGGKATLWKASDTVFSVVGTPGYSPKILDVALTLHGGKLLTACQLPGASQFDSTKISLLAQNGTGWTAHSELPRYGSASYGIDLVSFNNRLFAMASNNRDTTFVMEYKSNAWSPLSSDLSMWRARFFTAGTNLYTAGYRNADLVVRKLSGNSFTMVGGPIATGYQFVGDGVSVSEDSTGRPVIIANLGNYPNKYARVYRFEGGSWVLMQEFTTGGNLDVAALGRASGKLMLYYDHNGSGRFLYLNETTGKWVANGSAQYGIGGNSIQARIFQTTTGVSVIQGFRECTNLIKLYECAGY